MKDNPEILGIAISNNNYNCVCFPTSTSIANGFLP